ncbi:hypothetical protein AAC387_Pa05g0763 [Persea americana]
MASPSTQDASPEILPWLKSLPLAPEYHPTLAEFQDPISYILKIEKEASKFGICKIVPPLPAPPKKAAISNLNRSIAARNPHKQPAFTTRQQQIGFCPRKSRPVQKPVWQSGESYTLQQFEAKAKHFEKTHLRKSPKKGLSALEVESLFWKATADKPFSVEYANDMPGSAFGAVSMKGGEAAATVAETAWNMRRASRAKGSLLRFMKEEIAGVTSPMVYVAMMFSWFAWHVEDHDLHSLNYLHLGPGKTWYGVPRDAAFAFEEVVRVHGYGGEVNPVVTFATLGEKTTVMSPEVLIGAGIPCCRLVQNAGEFVVTFPRAYHSGFSHGFNCGEAANIATPEWLKVAKEAAIRRASINYPPMVSHFQLLYSLASTLCSRVSMSTSNEPRSSRLKDKKRGEGEMMVKELFVKDVTENNDLLHNLLEKGSSCVLLPRDSLDISLCSNSRIGSQIMVKPRPSLGLCSPEEALEASGSVLCEDAVLDRNMRFRHLNGLCQRKRIPSVKYGQYASDFLYASTSDSQNMDSEKEGASQVDGLLDQGLFSCVTCGILSFACVAVIQPTEAAAGYLMSADCDPFGDQIVGLGATNDQIYNVTDVRKNNSDMETHSGRMEKDDKCGLYDVPVQSADYTIQVSHRRVEPASNSMTQGFTSLDLLANAYGDSSDSDEEGIQHPNKSICSDEHDFDGFSLASSEDRRVFLFGQDRQYGSVGVLDQASPTPSMRYEAPTQILSINDRCPKTLNFSPGNVVDNAVSVKPWGLDSISRNPMTTPGSMVTSRVTDFVMVGHKESDGSWRQCIGTSKISWSDAKLGDPANCISVGAANGKCVETAQFNDIDSSLKKPNISFVQQSDKDSSRMHIFCLEHAVEVEKQLRPIGGLHMLLLCHPDYPKVEAQAKSLAEELGSNYHWKDVHFRDATNDDKEKIRSALDDEEVVPGNGDWAVKLGVNLYYSANLSKSPLYSKQMPYNAVLYKAFGRTSLVSSPTKPKVFARRSSRQKKIVVAGKWCGKVWMSNQVHPYLANRDNPEQEPVNSSGYRDIDLKLEEDTDVQVGRTMLSERNLLPCTVLRKSSRKRRRPFEDEDYEKPKFPRVENTCKVLVDSPRNPSSLSRRILRSRLKHEEISYSNSSLKDEVGGPSTRLRTRPSKTKEVKAKLKGVKLQPAGERLVIKKKVKKGPSCNDVTIKDEEAEYQCDVEGCSMGFNTKQELMLHKRNICSVKGCGKKLFSHKYLVQHRRVHMDDRPLKCPWKGCKMTFKWAWARTEHIRVHTGARPYVCREPGCGQTFRFVSDFSRHKRKTGHSVKKGRT